MRHIRKAENGEYHLNQANATPPKTSKAATNRWSRFGHKEEVLTQLLFEQYNLCCYSELRADQHGIGYHIEHVENKHQNPQRTFDYSNLAASSFSSDNIPSFKNTHQDASQTQAVFGGHARDKQNTVDMQRFISPHQADCARFFAYLSDGRIAPAAGLDHAEQSRVHYTLELLNLNSPYLLTQRRRWWEELDDIYEYHITQGMDLYCLARIDLTPINQSLSPFFSITRQFFGRIAEEIFLQELPEFK
ncbi:retron system putative HNH endonuclease [Pseudomonas anguilliseptica]|uniref:retron system putative HNH endonuclease n=1 Tax=Pseudomonas anguilliseptica TaxID=53406 RepID=UPI001F4781EF|nr:retron system putative HNH endonuclease [Pseudomonas anguilliseptica]MCE5364132.1 TIGR02646 family protein [Pseudomonas anguilliseptica]